MKTHLATVAAACIALFAGTTLTAQEISAAPAAAAPAPSPNVAASRNSQSTDSAGASKVRIVRLSQIKGAVQLDRNTGQGFESGFPNLPIVEGAKLKTGDGFAEVEFEDDSTLRLVPNSLVTFPRLELLPSGAKASTVEVVQGTVYLSRANTKGDQFELAFANQTVFPQPSSHIRLEMQSPKAELAVLAGDVQMQGDGGATEIGKKKTVTFDLADQSQPTLAKNVAENENDAWDQSSLEYHKQYAGNSGAYGNTPYLYGLTDLNYYGDFADLGDCGSMWRPYFVGASWSPFNNGLWAWYAGMGYSWVSPYPWGWMPFHYGAWNFCPGFGWGWQPGGGWIGVNNSGLHAIQGGKPFVPIRAPLHPPVPGARTLEVVNHTPLPLSGLGQHNNFVFRNNSAGLGIPRGDLGSLNRFSRNAETNGFAAAQHVFVEPSGGRFGDRDGDPAFRGDRGDYDAGGGGLPRAQSNTRDSGVDRSSERPSDNSPERGGFPSSDSGGMRGGMPAGPPPGGGSPHSMPSGNAPSSGSRGH
ncbi:MAG TPA: DUF6600 domain-containing protein [Acidobacteriaceae bacterium]|nr:DUF6600 domain-containing protein [Acidobacteriaceae bacterium]